MYTYYPPTDLMEHLAEEKWYFGERARKKLLLVARYIDNPIALKQMEKEWLTNDTNY